MPLTSAPTLPPGSPAGGWSAWPAPAKLNLFLHLVGRRADGYHLLQTVFQLLDWGDLVHLRGRTDGRIERTSALPGISPDHDLCVRAARLLQQASGATAGADISLDKHIPIGGGLGGGSSDAASVLVGLNALWGTGLGQDALAQLGATLGADVPVFVRGHSAWAEGIGEELTPMGLEPAWFVILDPHEHVSTAAIFQAPELTRNTPRGTIPNFVCGDLVTNSFAPVVRARYAGVDAAMRWLGQFGLARLSGSGACVFAAFAEHAQALNVLKRCPARFSAHLARGVDVSPLRLAAQAFATA